MTGDTSRPDMSESDVPGAQALLRGLDVLLAIGAATQPPRFRDLEKAVEIPRASLHRLLAALVSRRLVRYEERTRTYHVGMRVLELSRRTLDQSAIIRVAKPELARVSRKLHRTCCIMVLDDDDVFVLDFEDADPSYGRLVRLWPRAAALDTAAGRSILAAMPREKSETILGGLVGHFEPQAAERVRADIAVAKALGYAVMPVEPATGRAGAASPILDKTGYPIGALSCLLETGEVPSEDLHEIGRVLAEGARRASGHVGMGYMTPAVSAKPDAPAGAGVEVVPAGRDFVGENPVWNAARQRLYWVDVLAPALRWWSPASREAGRVALPHLVGGIAFDQQDRLIAAGQNGLFVLDPETGSMKMLVNPESDRPDNRFNTVGVDPAGRLWAGTMAVNHEVGRGSLYQIDPDLTVHRRIEQVGLPKNVAFDRAGARMYFADAAQGGVFLFDYDLRTGALAQRRMFVSNDALHGVVNSVTVDAEDHVWVTALGGWRLYRFDPAGRPVSEIVLPVAMPTNCAFGGDDLSTLFVTSTWIRLPAGLSAESPASGQLLAISTPVRGPDGRRFGSTQTRSS